jgi:hypothetical protein
MRRISEVGFVGFARDRPVAGRAAAVRGAGPDARLTGARILAANRQSGAVVEYAIEERSLSYR